MHVTRLLAKLQHGGTSVAVWLLSVLPVLADTTDDDDDDYDPLPGRSDEQIEALIFNIDEVVETIALYTALFALLVILLTLAASMRLRRWVAYTMLSMLSLGWFALFEQHATGIYWIGVNVAVPMLAIVGTGLISAHFLTAGTVLMRTPNRRRLGQVLLVMALAAPAALALSWPVSDQALPLPLILLAVVASASHLLNLPPRATSPHRPVYTRRNAMVVLVGLALTGFVVFGELDEGFDISFAIRSLFVLVVLLFAFFLVQSVIGILRDRDASQRQALEIARREAAQASALLDAEKNYARAKEAARLHTQRLANASHDIRQPITSLRATMAAVARDQPQEVQTQLRSAFDYLDQLAQSYMETEDAPNAPEATQTEVETVSARMLGDTLDRMFREEAEGKGLAFSTDVADRQLTAPPLVITRVLSNLLSNAIQHTAQGSVTLTAGPMAGGYAFTVSNTAVLDLPDGAQSPFTRGVKGDGSEGSGFGLAIIKQLTGANGLTLEWSTTDPAGTEFRLGIPG